MSTQRRIFSGIRPSGDLHIGNYLGAIRQWLKLQDNHEVVFGIMDLHAITTPHEPRKLREGTLETAMLYLSAGLDPEQSTLTVQSWVPAHAELAWILGTMTPLGELERMTQFKEKAGVKADAIQKILEYNKQAVKSYRQFVKDLKAFNEAAKTVKEFSIEKAKEILQLYDENIKPEVEKTEKNILKEADRLVDGITEDMFIRKATMSGLLNYPVLMAADILLYQTNAVPVGEDQVQHVELARSIAERFNNRYGKTFAIPDAMIQKETARIMSLNEPTKKMSKSGESDRGYILLMDSPGAIREKIKSAVTDSGTDIRYDPEKKPAISNLLVIFSEFSGRPLKELEVAYAGKSYEEFKRDLAEAVIVGLGPLQKKLAELHRDTESVLNILRDGSAKAATIANKTLAEVKEKVGFLPS